MEVILTRGDYRDISGFGFCDQEIRDISEHLHLFYTGVTRESKNILATQKENLISDEEIIHNMHENVELANKLAEQLILKNIDVYTYYVKTKLGIEEKVCSKYK